MMGQLGYGLVLASLVAAGAGAVVGIGAGVRRSVPAWRLARRLAFTYAALINAAVLVMIAALVNHDFSVPYVAQVGSLATPLHITLVSLWSSLEGSILFWGGVLGIYIAAALWREGETQAEVMPMATGVFLVVASFFSMLLIGPANPFTPAPIPIPVDGPGPNPLLQNHILMIVHPPTLYLGFVGMTIPFGLAVGALWRGAFGPAQAAPLRFWLLVPWSFLSVGIVLGGWWAYEVLGWGGYWAWDPVENASFLPWLTATAALHAAMLPARRESMKGWTLTLVLVTFLLTLLGTFMTRSGVFNSVHAFSESDIGPVFLVFIAVCLFGCVGLLATRVDRLEGEGAVRALVSRESAFLLNNLLFVAFTFMVLVGTTFPLITEAVRGTKLSVGEPYFNRMAVPIGVAILFLMGVGPALPWGQATAERVRAQVLPPLGIALLGSGLAFVLGVQEPWPLLSVMCALFAAVVSLREILSPVADRIREQKESLVNAFLNAWSRNRRRNGAHVVHLGIILMIVSIALSSSYRVDAELMLSPGTEQRFEEYTLTLSGTRTETEAHRTREIAEVSVSGPGGSFSLDPALNRYGAMNPIGTPAVQSFFTHDLYLSVLNMDGDKVGIHAFRTPMMAWLWIGAGVVALGSLVLAWPRRQAAAAALPEGARVVAS